jgi:hypothetical protein
MLRMRSLPVLIVGLLLGSTLLRPAVAHVTDRVTHLFTHLDARYVRNAGVIAIPVMDGWIMGDSGITTTRGGTSTHFSGAPTDGSNQPTLTLVPTVPAALYGKKTRLVGVELCANFDPANIELDNLTLSVESSTEPSSSAGNNVVDDGTTRNDSVCRMYRGTPLVLEENSYVTLKLRVQYSGAADWHIQRTTFFMSPTRMVADLPPA